MRAYVFPHLVMPVGPFVSAVRAPVAQMLSNPPAREHGGLRQPRRSLLGFVFFTADFLAPFFALLFPRALAAW